MNYNNIPVSTYTFSVKSNIQINTDAAFLYIKNITSSDPNNICGIKYSGNVSKKNMWNKIIQKSGNTNDLINFLHACTITYLHPEKTNGKPINIKMYNTGTLHITGCKTIKQCIDTVKYIYNKIKDVPHIIYFDKNMNPPIFNIFTSMKNIHFKFDFIINRQKLYNFLIADNSTNNYIVSYEDQIMTGVNIKKQITSKYDNIIKMNMENDTEEIEQIEIIHNKIKTITFIIFYSGVCRFSGSNDDFMRESFYEFIKYMQDNREKYEDVNNMNDDNNFNRIKHIPSTKDLLIET
jgi:TATA-box binding protein (TBP) (component of TFIID and TFIIIB)